MHKIRLQELFAGRRSHLARVFFFFFFLVIRRIEELERFSFDWRKHKTKVIATTNKKKV